MKSRNSWITIALISVAVCFLHVGSLFGKQVSVPEVDAANFLNPVDNPWQPMAIGETYVYLAEDEDGIILNEIINTGNIKTIMGIDCYIIHDVEWIYIEELAAWFVTEETDDWYAWDKFGNVWYFGESTIEYLYDDDWNPTGTSSEGSWEAGIDGASPGILMLAVPSNGLSYYQEYYEGEAEDQGKVLRTNAMVSVEYGDFSDCLVTKEWTNLSPGEVEHKYYAAGVGLVYIEELKEKTVYVELVDIY